MSNSDQVAGLKWFQLEANGISTNRSTAQVYRNGRHQIRVTVTLRAVDNKGHVVLLGEDDIRKVELINYNGSKLSSDLSRQDSWRGYDEQPSRMRTEDTKTNPGNSTAQVWLSAGDNARLTTHHIAAKITLNGIDYYTNDSSVANKGGATEAGNSDSSFNAQVISTYTLGASYFHAIDESRTQYYGFDNPAGAESRFLVRWRIEFRDGAYRIHGTDVEDKKPIPWFSQYIRNGNDTDCCTWLLPFRKADRNSKVYLGWNRSGSDYRDCWVKPYRNEHSVYVIIEHAKCFNIHSYNAWPITITDNYGCTHKLVVRPNNNGSTVQIDDK